MRRTIAIATPSVAFGFLFLMVGCGHDYALGADAGPGAGDAQGGATPQPQIVITHPPRGTTLDGDGTLVVEGMVTRAQAALRSLTINGVPVTPSPDGRFSLPVRSRHGMNVVTLEASSADGSVQTQARAYYYASAWLPPASEKAAPWIKQGLLGWLGQGVFDDKVSGSNKDLVAVLNRTLAGLDIASLLPKKQKVDGLAGCDVDIEIDRISYGRPAVSIDVKDGSLLVVVTIRNFKARVDADADGDWYNPLCALKVSGWVEADQITATAAVDAGAVEGTLQAKSRVSVRVDRFDIDIRGLLGSLSNWLVNRFEDDLARDLEKELAGLLDKELTPLLQDGIGELGLDGEFTVDPLIGVGPTATVGALSRIGVFEMKRGGVHYAFDAVAEASEKRIRSTLGSIRHGDCGKGPFSFTQTAQYPLQVAINDDLVNRLLYALHQGGILRAELAQADFQDDLDSFGVTEMKASVDGLLPPIFNSCTPNNIALLQLGGLSLVLDFKILGSPAKVGIFLSLEATAELVTERGDKGPKLILKATQLPTHHLDIVDLTKGKTKAYASVKALLEDHLVPKLVEKLKKKYLAFDLPELDLRTLDKNMPAGSKIVLRVAQVTRRSGYTVVLGRVE